MPTSLGSFIALIAALLPGWVYVQRRDTFTPAVPRSDLSEVADILWISAIAWAMVGLVSIPIAGMDPIDRWAIVDIDPLSVPTLAVDASVEAERRFGWGLLYLSVAAAGAWIVSLVRYGDESDRQSRQNAWRYVFKSTSAARRGRVPWAILYVKEPGWWLSGWVDEFPGAATEIENRDLVLVPPIARIVDGKPIPVDVDYLVVNERDFTSLMVNFHRKHPNDPPPGAVPDAGGIRARMWGWVRRLRPGTRHGSP